MAYLNLNTQQYPISEQEIHNLYPNTSFTVPFKAPEEFAWVFPSPQPEVTNLQFAREIAPALSSKGNYEQQWEVQDKFSTQEEIDEYLEQQRKASVPLAVSMRQAKLALLQVQLLEAVNTAIAVGPANIQIEWEYATEVPRDWPTISAMQESLGLTDRQLDDLFVLAKGL